MCFRGKRNLMSNLKNLMLLNQEYYKPMITNLRGMVMILCKIPLIVILKHILGGLISVGGDFCRSFCVSIFVVSRLVKSIIISMKYGHYWQRRAIFNC